VSSFVLPTEEAATFAVVATARPGVEPERLLAALDEHLDALQDEPPDDAALAQALHRQETAFFDQLQSIEQRAELLGGFTTFFDQPERLATEADRYRALRGDDLLAFARASLARERRAVVSVVPEGEATVEATAS